MNQDATSITDTPGRIKSILDKLASQPGDLLPVLHAIQDAIGFIPAESVADIAGAFNLSRAEVHGVITFYHHFRTTPAAKHAIQICRAEACQSMGAEQLLAHAEKALGCRLHAKSADDSFSLEPVYCLGQCATSPAIMIGDAVHARVTPARFDRLIALAKETP
jgi:formate dehydrogenase subunit gamma